MPSTSLVKRDWEKDHVYLIQFPRAGSIPSVSPFAFKMETWLRIADIPYTNVSNNFTGKSSRGQIPFIELNGRQISDSNLIIDHLITEFHKEDLDGSLVPADRAVSRAFYTLCENRLAWVVIYSRSLDFSWMGTEKGVIGHFQGIKGIVFKKLIIGRLQGNIKDAVFKQGFGRLSKEEMLSEAKKDVDAVSIQLGNKKYLFGDKIRTVDAVAFAVLAQLLYTPLWSDELVKHIEEKLPNLVAYVNRIKERFWPDWDEATSKLSLDTKWKAE